MAFTSPVWLVTGCSTGIGRELVRAILRHGWRVVATARDPASLKEFSHEDAVLTAGLDVTHRSQVGAIVAQAEERFGGIDVLVNNAGYGYRAAVEEGEDENIRALFETNFFGLVRMCKTVLPGMRARGRGHIVNISSVSGVIGSAGLGFYSATKFAVEGLSEAMAAEIRPFGLGVTIVEPGPFRTDFSGRSIKSVKTEIPEYTAAGIFRSISKQNNDNKPGDPARAAEAIIQAVQSPTPPLRLALGRMAYQLVAAKLHSSETELEIWKEVALAADFPVSGDELRSV